MDPYSGLVIQTEFCTLNHLISSVYSIYSFPTNNQRVILFSQPDVSYPACSCRFIFDLVFPFDVPFSWLKPL